jgi:hypothetical protein
MKKIVLLLILFFSVTSGSAHPGIGIVCDSKGNIYYTDLKQVWKITPDGKKSVVVPNVHTHELYIDANDDLYGEHLWYNGEKLNTWGYYIWCLRHDGTLTKVKESTEGFRTDYSFVRDSAGNMYWVEQFTASRFKKKAPDGTITTIAEGKFRDIRWSYCTKNGIYYFIDLDRLYKLTPDGKFTLITDKLDDAPTVLGFLNDKRHRVYGIWTDTQDNIYVALLAAKKVKRISPDGTVQTVVHTREPWSPTGGVFDKEGNMWLLEGSITNECRARKITAKELFSFRSVTKSFLLNNIIPVTVIILVFTMFFLMIRKTGKLTVSFFKKTAG